MRRNFFGMIAVGLLLSLSSVAHAEMTCSWQLGGWEVVTGVEPGTSSYYKPGCCGTRVYFDSNCYITKRIQYQSNDTVYATASNLSIAPGETVPDPIYYASYGTMLINQTLSPDEIDQDGDGYSPFQGDCDDTDISIYPGAPETYNDGIDQDCNGEDLIATCTDGIQNLDETGVDCGGSCNMCNPGPTAWGGDGSEDGHLYMKIEEL